jgi:hypothetical protein
MTMHPSHYALLTVFREKCHCRLEFVSAMEPGWPLFGGKPLSQVTRRSSREHGEVSVLCTPVFNDCIHHHSRSTLLHHTSQYALHRQGRALINERKTHYCSLYQLPAKTLVLHYYGETSLSLHAASTSLKLFKNYSIAICGISLRHALTM